MKLIGLALLFTVTACLYASVGFGGGSTYSALLVAGSLDFYLIPIIALSCNIAVVLGNTLRYSRAGLVPWERLWPILILSVPMAWVGGRLNISETLFIGLLALALFFAGFRLIFKTPTEYVGSDKVMSHTRNAAIGGLIGFYAGLVGIGGGIFLAPILYALNWGRAKVIAATCSVFILFNSISGFLGQFMKLTHRETIWEAAAYWPLIPAVLIGGFVGNSIGLKRFSPHWIQRLTGILILVVAVRLSFNWAGRIF